MSNRETFTDALEVRCAQMAALVANKQEELDKAKAEEDSLTIKVAEGDSHAGAVLDQRKTVEVLKVELKGCQLLLDRELRRKDEPGFLANLASADEALLACGDDGTFHRRFTEEIAPRLAELSRQLGQVYSATLQLAQSCREPFLHAKRLQGRLGGIRILNDEAGLHPYPEVINALFRGTFETALTSGAGEYSSQVYYTLFDR